MKVDQIEADIQHLTLSALKPAEQHDIGPIPPGYEFFTRGHNTPGPVAIEPSLYRKLDKEGPCGEAVQLLE